MLNIYRDTDSLLAVDKKNKNAIGIVEKDGNAYYSLYKIKGHDFSDKAVNNGILYGSNPVLLAGLAKPKNHHLILNYRNYYKNSEVKSYLSVASNMLVKILKQLDYSIVDCSAHPQSLGDEI